MPRKGLPQTTKLDIIKRKDRGERNKDIARHYGVNESTIRTILKQRDGILQTAMALGVDGGTSHRIRVADPALVLMERYLVHFCKKKSREGVPIDTLNIRQTARTLYQTACRKLNQEPRSFKASTGWFSLFKRRFELKRVRVTGERATADHDAADHYPEVLRHIIEEGQYSPHQIYNIDETGLEYKRMPKSTYITKEEKQARGRKPDRKKQTILFACNLAGHKLQPLFVSKVAKPHCFKHLTNMRQSGVYWAKTASGWNTNKVMRDWFKDFVKDTRKECKARGVPFKILLLLDNASCHGFLEEIHPAVRVEYLPPNTTSLIQPLDQEIIANFKFAYEEQLYLDLRSATDNRIEEVMMMEEELHANAETEDAAVISDDDLEPAAASTSAASTSALTPAQTVTEYWKRYNMKNVVENVLKAWEKVTPATINHAWRRLVPHLTTETSEEAVSPELSRATALAACRAVPGCEAVTAEEISEVIEDHTSPEEAQSRVEAMDEEFGAVYAPPQVEEQEEVKDITLRQCNSILAVSEAFMEALQEHDPQAIRQNTSLAEFRKLISPYEELRRHKLNKCRQQTLDNFFRRQERQSESESESDEDVRSVVSSFSFEGFGGEEEREDSTDVEEEAPPSPEGAAGGSH